MDNILISNWRAWDAIGSFVLFHWPSGVPINYLFRMDNNPNIIRSCFYRNRVIPLFGYCGLRWSHNCCRHLRSTCWIVLRLERVRYIFTRSHNERNCFFFLGFYSFIYFISVYSILNKRHWCTPHKVNGFGRRKKSLRVRTNHWIIQEFTTKLNR